MINNITYEGSLRFIYVAQWDCMDYNIASNRIAEKPDFKFFEEERVYWFEI